MTYISGWFTFSVGKRQGKLPGQTQLSIFHFILHTPRWQRTFMESGQTISTENVTSGDMIRDICWRLFQFNIVFAEVEELTCSLCEGWGGGGVLICADVADCDRLSRRVSSFIDFCLIKSNDYPLTFLSSSLCPSDCPHVCCFVSLSPYLLARLTECPPVYWSVSLSLYLLDCLSDRPPVYSTVSLSPYLLDCLSYCPPACWSVSLSPYLLDCLSDCPPVYFSESLSAYLFDCLSDCPPFYLYLYI